MNNELKESILYKVIQNLPVSEEFKTMAAINGFETIDEMLSFQLSSLMKKEKFSMHLVEELYKILEKEELVHLLKSA